MSDFDKYKKYIDRSSDTPTSLRDFLKNTETCLGQSFRGNQEDTHRQIVLCAKSGCNICKDQLNWRLK